MLDRSKCDYMPNSCNQTSRGKWESRTATIRSLTRYEVELLDQVSLSRGPHDSPSEKALEPTETRPGLDI